MVNKIWKFEIWRSRSTTIFVKEIWRFEICISYSTPIFVDKKLDVRYLKKPLYTNFHQQNLEVQIWRSRSTSIFINKFESSWFKDVALHQLLPIKFKSSRFAKQPLYKKNCQKILRFDICIDQNWCCDFCKSRLSNFFDENWCTVASSNLEPSFFLTTIDVKQLLQISNLQILSTKIGVEWLFQISNFQILSTNIGVERLLQISNFQFCWQKMVSCG